MKLWLLALISTSLLSSSLFALEVRMKARTMDTYLAPRQYEGTFNLERFKRFETDKSKETELNRFIEAVTETAKRTGDKATQDRTESALKAFKEAARGTDVEAFNRARREVYENLHRVLPQSDAVNVSVERTADAVTVKEIAWKRDNALVQFLTEYNRLPKLTDGDLRLAQEDYALASLAENNNGLYRMVHSAARQVARNEAESKRVGNYAEVLKSMGLLTRDLDKAENGQPMDKIDPNARTKDEEFTGKENAGKEVRKALEKVVADSLTTGAPNEHTAEFVRSLREYLRGNEAERSAAIQGLVKMHDIFVKKLEAELDAIRKGGAGLELLSHLSKAERDAFLKALGEIGTGKPILEVMDELRRKLEEAGYSAKDIERMLEPMRERATKEVFTLLETLEKAGAITKKDIFDFICGNKANKQKPCSTLFSSNWISKNLPASIGDRKACLASITASFAAGAGVGAGGAAVFNAMQDDPAHAGDQAVEQNGQPAVKKPVPATGSRPRPPKRDRETP